MTRRRNQPPRTKLGSEPALRYAVGRSMVAAALVLSLLCASAADASAADAPVGTMPASSATPHGSPKTRAGADAARSDDGYRIDRGDKLRIRFLDRYDRADLNGDYTIGESGQLRLSRLGLFDVRNMTTTEIEQSVRESVESRGEKLGYFYIEIAECRPIYVSGLANRPGAYPFVSGLSVVHAVALAGGIYRSPATMASESLRELSKASETLEKLKQPIARKARLEAELKGLDKIAVPADLVDLDPINAKDIIAREQASLEANREMDAREESSLKGMVTFSQSEVDSFDAEIATMNDRIAEQSKLFERLKALHNQKIVNVALFNQSLVNLDSVQRDKQLAIAGVARAKASLEKARKDLLMVRLTAKSRVNRDLAETDGEISRLKALAEQQQRLASRLGRSTARSATNDDAVRYRIMRRNPAGVLVSMSATETTPLLPGDIVQVEAPEPDARISLH